MDYFQYYQLTHWSPEYQRNIVNGIVWTSILVFNITNGLIAHLCAFYTTHTQPLLWPVINSFFAVESWSGFARSKVVLLTAADFF